MEVSIPDNLEELKRNKLQSLCKTFKIPANLKNVELIRRLTELRQCQLSDQVVSNENDAQSDTAVVTSPITVTADPDHDDDDDDDDDENIKKKGTSNRRRSRRVGHSRRQKRCRKTKMTTNDDVMMNDDHVIKCPEGTNTGNHGDSRTSNPPPVVFTPAKEIINEDNVISSSARRRRKCWSEVEHNESIEELFDRMASSSANTAVPVVDMDTNSNDDDDNDEVTGVIERFEDEGQHHCDDMMREHDTVESTIIDDTQEHTKDDDQPPRKRRRRSTFDVESSTMPVGNVIDDDSSSNVTVQDDNATQTPDSNKSSLSNQFMNQKKQKPVTIGNSSLFTEQSLSPLVTNSQTASLGVTVDDDEDKVKEEMTAILEDRVKLRKSQCTGSNAKEREGATTAGRKRKLTHSVTTHNSKIPVPKPAKRIMTAKDFDKIHQKNFNRSQSIVEYNNRRQRHLSSVTPLSNSSSINNNNATGGVKCSSDGYSFKDTQARLNQTVSSSGVFRFIATSSSTKDSKRHRETAERRKSYNAQSSAKKKPRSYKPYTGKLPPMPPIRNY